MANFYLEGTDEIIRELEKLVITADDVSMKMVDEAAEIMDKELSTAIRDNTKKYGTGTLAGSIHHNKPTRSAMGIFTVSTAKGTDNRGKGKKKNKTKHVSSKGKEYETERKKNQDNSIRNQDKLWYLENGNSRQPARPIIAKCVRRAEPRVLDKMQAVFNRETRNL